MNCTVEYVKKACLHQTKLIYKSLDSIPVILFFQNEKRGPTIYYCQ